MVNPAITAALIAASRQEEVAKKIEGRLKKARAFGPGSAIPLDVEGKQKELLDQALASGSVKQTAEGRFYLNERAIADRAEGQGFMALLIIVVIASLIASLVVLTPLAGD